MIYLIFAICLSMLGASSYLAVKNLTGLEVDLELPTEIYAKRETFFTINLKNTSKERKFFIDIKLLTKTAHIDVLDKTAKINLKFKENSRGKKVIPNISISSTYPLGFFLREKSIEVKQEYFVFPEIKNVRLNLTTSSGNTQSKISNEGDYYSLDDYVEGMDARRIYWKVSAKLDKEKIIKLASNSLGTFRIVFNISKTSLDKEQFEEAVIKIASLVHKFFYSKVPFEFITGDEVVNCRSFEEYVTIMRYLSTVDLETVVPIDNEINGIKIEDIEYA